MTPQQIVALAVRLYAIWLGLPAFFSIISPNEQTFLLPWILMLLFAVLLWFFPLTVAHKLIPKTQFEDHLSVPAREAVTVACIVFSLWLFISYLLPSFARYLTLIAIALKRDQPITIHEEFHLEHLMPIAIEFAVVWLMMFKARRISAFLLSDKKPENDEVATDETAG